MWRSFIILFMSLGLLGCSTDEREVLIQQVRNNLQSAQGQFDTISDEIESGIKRAKERAVESGKAKSIEDLKPDQIGLKTSDLQSATDATKQLGELGKKLQLITQKARQLDSTAGKTDSEKYQQLFADLKTHFNSLQKAQTSLDEALDQAKNINAEATEAFENAYKDALSEYEILAKEQ